MPEGIASALRAVVVGAGWAGEGHTVALQHAGVEVAAICGRNQAAVETMAARLGVPVASTDWRRTIEALRPDIVAIATPAGLRGEVVEAALAGGSHLFCDKPLATSAPEAERLYRLADAAGVKHAFAATHVYDPSVQWLAELVREGSIGTLREIVGTFRLDHAQAGQWSWNSLVASGGGVLHQGLPHYLALFEAIAGGPAVRVAGDARVLVRRAPVVPQQYGADGRKLKGSPLAAMSEAERAQLEWRECDADNAFSVLLALAGAEGEVHATLLASRGFQVPGEPNRLRLYGDKGTLVADGTLFSFEVSRTADGKSSEPLPVPQRLKDELPAVGDGVQNKWCRLALDFVAHVRGEAFRPYLTFYDGWRYQLAIDAVRAGAWTALPEAPEADAGIAPAPALTA